MSLTTGTPLPSLAEVTAWLDGETKREDLQGWPVLVQFWAISCPVCKTNMPLLQEFVDTYRENGLRLVSVHMPRCEADTDLGKIQAVKEQIKLNGPCAVDNTHAVGGLFEVKAWPSYFLFDAQGRLRSRAAGALGIKLAENSLKRMLVVAGRAEREPVGATA